MRCLWMQGPWPAGVAIKGSAGTRARHSALALGDVGWLPRRLEEEVQLLWSLGVGRELHRAHLRQRLPAAAGEPAAAPAGHEHPGTPSAAPQQPPGRRQAPQVRVGGFRRGDDQQRALALRPAVLPEPLLPGRLPGGGAPRRGAPPEPPQPLGQPAAAAGSAAEQEAALPAPAQPAQRQRRRPGRAPAGPPGGRGGYGGAPSGPPGRARGRGVGAGAALPGARVPDAGAAGAAAAGQPSPAAAGGRSPPGHPAQPAASEAGFGQLEGRGVPAALLLGQPGSSSGPWAVPAVVGTLGELPQPAGARRGRAGRPGTGQGRALALGPGEGAAHPPDPPLPARRPLQVGPGVPPPHLDGGTASHFTP